MEILESNLFRGILLLYILVGFITYKIYKKKNYRKAYVIKGNFIKFYFVFMMIYYAFFVFKNKDNFFDSYMNATMILAIPCTFIFAGHTKSFKNTIYILILSIFILFGLVFLISILNVFSPEKMSNIIKYLAVIFSILSIISLITGSGQFLSNGEFSIDLSDETIPVRRKKKTYNDTVKKIYVTDEFGNVVREVTAYEEKYSGAKRTYSKDKLGRVTSETNTIGNYTKVKVNNQKKNL